MGLPILSVDSGSRPATSPDVFRSKLSKSTMDPWNPFASVTMGEEPFNFLRALCDGVIAGATAGVVVETVLYPIDTIKTRLQAGCSWCKQNPLERLVLWIGWKSCRSVATAGAVGGVAASLIRVPTEVVKQRMQTGQFTSAPNAVRLIVAKEGIRGLYAGYSSFLLRDLPFDAIQFCIYEQLRIGYKIAAQRELSDPENAIIGAFAGALTGAITTPLDVLKTRLMVQGSANQYKGVISCAQTILKEEGPAAFFKGIGPRVLWIGIGGSIFFGVLERSKLVLSQRHFDQVLKP
ncbi:S-adenosylmethionine carrier 1, chloroplastic/mitochondrial-like isoform X2 [Musa acuminata AAA Group]|uniref:S-adenosylmethionine carrier 1, chloroplastic/mitochondrial isoform X3 n=1 Tax=Musa acuminata AAA Group TaxID=214697 RepID=UPI0031DE38E6